jgi:hypothetical protein
MDNRIQELRIQDGQLIPAQAEVWTSVVPEKQTPTTELSGRLMGPRCPFSNTVEIAYPLGIAPPSHTPPGLSGLIRRVVIPEACLWEPESPFLYQGLIELWQDGRRCDQVAISRGLRYFLIGKNGLTLNSRPLMLHGQAIVPRKDEEALVLRQQGYNLLIVPIEPDTLAVWERADRLGFFVLGQIMDHSEETLRCCSLISQHTSCLGWLVEKGKHPPLDQLPGAKCLVGLISNANPPQHYLPWLDFLFGPAELANLGKLLLVKGEGSPHSSEGCPILGNVP